MRCYLVDEIRPEDIRKLEDRLSEMQLEGGLPGVYKLPVPERMLSAKRREHADTCAPYYMAMEVEGESIKLEFLVRSEEKMRCQCVGYATPELQAHMMQYIDGLLFELGIKA
ncbi:MAG: hypothetical protein ACLFSY_04150 [Desulfonatronovibrionaceae bacterium]